MSFFLLFSINIFLWLLAYFFLRKKVNDTLRLKEIENNLNELVIAFNRNAQINLRLLEEKESNIKKCASKVDDALERYRLLEIKKNNAVAHFSESAISTKPQKNPTSNIYDNAILHKDSTMIKKLKTNQEKVYFLMERRFSEKEMAKKLQIPMSELKLLISLAKDKHLKSEDEKIVQRKKKILQKGFLI